MPFTPPADGSPAVAVLDDGPAAGERVEVTIGHLLPPASIVVEVMHLDERAETVEWRPTRYCRAALYRTRSDVEEPWAYFHHPAPAELGR
jgi:hypothetical protein